MAKMTKEEFYQMRDQQRAAGLITEYQAPINENGLYPDEEQRILEALNGQTRGIYRTEELGLTGLLCIEIYIGKRVKARRNKVDEIDNVTVWMI